MTALRGQTPGRPRIFVSCPAITMKMPVVGPLSWTAEERKEYARTKKWPARDAQASDRPAGLSLTSLPSEEYLRGYLAALGEPRSRGRKSERGKHLQRAIECLREKDGRTEEARKLYVARSPEVQRDTASRQFSSALYRLSSCSRSMRTRQRLPR
jgi:hypothetical protein